jgi:ribosome-associated protein
VPVSTIQITELLEIPFAELRFQFSRSSGPGGQHVNRASTRVELLFDVAHSPSLDDAQRSRILDVLENYIDKEGILHLVSQTSRSQWRNREDVTARFQQLLRRALRRRKQRRPTRPTRASKEQRLAEKRKKSEVKRTRRRVSDD